MNIKHILTWNIDWFRNGKRSGHEEWVYLEKDSSKEVYDSIVKIIKKYLEKDGSLVFLQEVPYKAEISGKGERVHFLYKQLYEDFPKEKYDVFVNEVSAYRCTIAIAKKGDFEAVSVETLTDNRTVAVQKDEYVFIGTHMPTGFNEQDKGDKNRKKWNDLLSYVKKKKSGIFLCGDFNVYIGCQKKPTESMYLELLEYMNNYVDEKRSTFKGNTSIDKALLYKKENRLKVSKIEIQEEYSLSDHKYINVELTAI